MILTPCPYDPNNGSRDISSTAAFRTAIDQAAETGHTIVIVGFGAAGYCGLCNGQLTNATWVAWFKAQVDYAKSKDIETSAYAPI